MDLSENNNLQKRNGDQLDPQLIPQFGAPIGMVPVTSTGTSSPFPIWANLSSQMAEQPFNSNLLNQPSNKFRFPGMIPQTGLPSFPSEPGFIERAARLSCFSTNGGFTSLMNSSILKGEINSMSIGAGSSNLEKNNDILNGDDNLKDENENITDSTDTGGKKRKRTNQDQLMDNAQGNNERSPDENQNNSEGKREADTNTNNNNNKNNGKNNNNNNNNKEGSDSKGDYIHVRARRGQATNSHSLAERVRREKISERMKYLQELVPGCSKVTGKAVMLDEIINYVQSLQRQVEFLSMKLAAVNPRLDLNIESLLSKDILQGRLGCSSPVGFTPEMFHSQLSQPGLLPPGLAGMLNQPDPFRRPVNTSQLGPFKDPNPQMANPWQDELHNVMSMNFNPNPPMSTQEGNTKPGDGFQI